MKLPLYIPLLLLILAISSPAANWEIWWQERQIDLKEISALPEQEQIPRLGVYLASTGLPDATLNDMQHSVVSEARTRLLRIPGHAEFYRDRIIPPYLAFRTEAQGGERSGRLNDYLNESMYGLAILSLLPSPETVRVLGEMLKEDWIYQADTTTGDDALRVQLSGSAGAAMQRLPLLDALTSNMQPDWRAWYAEVKSGQRSFAFRGQPVSYRFKADGSVETTARDASQDPADPLSKGTRPAEASKPDSAEKQPSAAPAGVLPWVAGGIALLLAASINFFLRKRK